MREKPRPGAGWFAGDIKQVFDAYDGAIEGSKRRTPARTRVRGVGGGSRRASIDSQTRAGALAANISNTRESRFQAIAT